MIAHIVLDVGCLNKVLRVLPHIQSSVKTDLIIANHNLSQYRRCLIYRFESIKIKIIIHVAVDCDVLLMMTLDWNSISILQWDSQYRRPHAIYNHHFDIYRWSLRIPWALAMCVLWKKNILQGWYQIIRHSFSTKLIWSTRCLFQSLGHWKSHPHPCHSERLY